MLNRSLYIWKSCFILGIVFRLETGANMHSFTATYQIRASSLDDAMDWAESVAREETIECIDEGVPHAFILDEVLGKVDSVCECAPSIYQAVIRYNREITGDELPQLINVLYGNTSMHMGVKLVDIGIPPETLKQFPGPQYGSKGVREQTKRRTGPLLCTVLKPVGLTPDELAELAYQCVLGGVDLIKDDHSFGMQKWAPFEKRVETIAAAVAKGNAETGNSTLYAPSMNCPLDKFEDRARFAVQAGASAYLVMPGLTGWDSVRFLASSRELSRPIMVHPSGLGSIPNAGANGVSYSMIYAIYPRLVGADVSIYPSFGGRYGFSKELCVQVADDCRDPNGLFQPILPAPGGGMKIELAQLLREMYGDDAVFLFGGGAMRYKDRIASGVKELRAALTQ
jgi:ribulose-bisphosphate carboxylase large chain